MLKLYLRLKRFVKIPYRRYESYFTDHQRYAITVYDTLYGELYYIFEDEDDIKDTIKRLLHDESVLEVVLHDNKKRIHYTWIR